MKRIIVNADDCGKSVSVDECIEKARVAGKLSSTTIMANMDDFEGAVRLYKEYKEQVSFGWHINLDEGETMTHSQLLLDKGFFVERNGRSYLNGKGFGKKYLDRSTRDEIRKELKAQWGKLRDSGIEISHADSHHFYHTQPSMLLVMPSLFKELGIKRCRQVSNYGFSGLSSAARSLWAAYMKARGMIMPETFCSFNQYYSNSNNKQGETIELMCHPGHSDPIYIKEYECLMKTDVSQWGAKLITYREI